VAFVPADVSRELTMVTLTATSTASSAGLFIWLLIILPLGALDGMANPPGVTITLGARSGNLLGRPDEESEKIPAITTEFCAPSARRARIDSRDETCGVGGTEVPPTFQLIGGAVLRKTPMRVLNVRHLKGVSAWSATAALYAVIGEVPDCLIDSERALSLECQLQQLCLPLYLAQAAAGRRKGRLAPREPVDLVSDLAGDLQFLCGEFHGARRIWRTTSSGTCAVVFECREFALAEACLRAAVTMVNTLLSGGQPALAETYATLLAVADQFSPVNLPGLVISAAADRGIPIFRLGPDHAFGLAPDAVLQLGEGIYQKRLHPWGTMTDRTGFLAGHLANDKAFVKALWSQHGIPVPEGSVVIDECGARRAAARIGGHVIIKPADAECGRGLTRRPATPEAVSAAFSHAQAASASGNVIVERFVDGAWHRLLVVNQRLVAAVRREPASVVGDGRHTIGELVAIANDDCRRGPDHRWPLRFLALNEIELENLAVEGLTCNSVLPQGKRVFLRETASAAAGAESFDVTEQVHPETRKLAVDAARLVGLDIAGLDLIAADISQPLSAQDGAFLEINEQPAIFMHAAPLCSPPRPVAEAIVESLFPGGQNGRVPLVVVVGRQMADCVAEFLADTLASAGRAVGLSTPQVTRLGDRSVRPAGPELPDRLSVLLRHPRTEAAVVSAPLEGILATGLGTDRCTVLVLADSEYGCTGVVEAASCRFASSDARDPAGCQIDNGYVESRRDVNRLLQRLLRSAVRTVVNADTPFWKSVGVTGCAEVCLVARQRNDRRLCEHLAAGGVAAFLEPAGMIMQTGGAPPQVHSMDVSAEDSERLEMRLARAIARASYVSFIRVVGTSGGEEYAHSKSIDVADEFLRDKAVNRTQGPDAESTRELMFPARRGA
jgi:cyanophycin synthetase